MGLWEQAVFSCSPVKIMPVRDALKPGVLSCRFAVKRARTSRLLVGHAECSAFLSAGTQVGVEHLGGPLRCR